MSKLRGGREESTIPEHLLKLAKKCNSIIRVANSTPDLHFPYQVSVLFPDKEEIRINYNKELEEEAFSDVEFYIKNYLGVREEEETHLPTSPPYNFRIPV